MIVRSQSIILNVHVLSSIDDHGDHQVFTANRNGVSLRAGVSLQAGQRNRPTRYYPRNGCRFQSLFPYSAKLQLWDEHRAAKRRSILVEIEIFPSAPCNARWIHFG